MTFRKNRIKVLVKGGAKMMEFPKEVRLTLKMARLLLGLTQKKVAEELQVTEETVRNWEQGKSYPDVIKVQAIERLYGLSYNQIIFL